MAALSSAAGLPATAWAILGAIVGLAFATEAALGFGAMVIALALGAQVAPIDRLLPILVPLNLGLSLYLVGRYARSVDRSFLFRRMAPAVLLGVPVGLYAFANLPSGQLVRGFGAFVVLLAASELVRLVRGGGAPRLAGPLRATLLALGGAVHGAFSTGGPLIVYVVSREIADKQRFRATLAALWALLGAILCVTYGASGQLGLGSLGATGALLVPAGIGLVVGEWLHRRAQAATFRGAVYAMLLVAGGLLVLR